jgi:uncharacterized protein (DUF433 family)
MLKAITINPAIQGGTPCFEGTRVPVKSLFDYLAHGRTLDYFLTQFTSVKRADAIAVLNQASQSFTPETGAKVRA